jgi:predicted dinucleotide-utilizing enzyme
MNTVLSPLVSEFDTVEQEALYTKWLLDKVQASLDSTIPGTPHDQVMADVDAVMEAASQQSIQQ